MKFLSTLVMAVCLFAISCERHDFEGPYGTKQLNEKHGAHGHSHGEHTDDAGAEGDNAAH